MSDKVGVLEAERLRRQRWDDLGLPDPIQVLAEESMTRLLYGPDWTHPGRAELDAYFDAHPDERRPNGW